MANRRGGRPNRGLPRVGRGRWHLPTLDTFEQWAQALASLETWADSLARLPSLVVLHAPLGEEPGWRLFALALALRFMSVNAAATTIGLVWGFWHLPLKLAEANGAMSFAQGIGMRLVITQFLSHLHLFARLFLDGNGSLWPVIALHACFFDSAAGGGPLAFILTVAVIITLMWTGVPADPTKVARRHRPADNRM